MLLTLAAIVALAAAFAYLLWSVGAQYPDTTMRTADRPDEEERLARRGSPLSTPASTRRQAVRRLRARPPQPNDPGIPTAVSVDRGLAEMLIAEAAAAGVRPRRLARARRELGRGDRFAATGRFEKAVSRYGRAWVAARHALDRAR